MGTPDIHSGQVAVITRLTSNDPALFRIAMGGPIEVVADGNTLIPGLPLPFNGFGYDVCVDSGNVLFEGRTSNFRGLYLWHGGCVIKLIDSLDLLDDQVIRDFAITSHSLEGTLAAFHVDFQDGTQAIYRAEIDLPFLRYGSGLAGTGGFEPTLTGDGCPAPEQSFTLHVAQGMGGSFGGLMMGSQSASIPYNGGTGLLQPTFTIWHYLSGPYGDAGVGQWSTTIQLPGNPYLTGNTAYFQGLYSDPQAPQGVSLTAGLEVRIP